MPARNTLVQLLALYTLRATMHSVTDRQTDRRTDGRLDEEPIILCSSTIGWKGSRVYPMWKGQNGSRLHYFNNPGT